MVKLRGSQLINYDMIATSEGNYSVETIEYLEDIPPVNLTDAISCQIAGRDLISNFTVLRCIDITPETREYYLDQLVSYSIYLQDNGFLSYKLDFRNSLESYLAPKLALEEAQFVTIKYFLNESVNGFDSLLSKALFLSDNNTLVFDAFASSLLKISLEKRTCTNEWTNSLTDYLGGSMEDEVWYYAPYLFYGLLIDIPIAKFTVKHDFTIDMKGQKAIPFVKIDENNNIVFDGNNEIVQKDGTINLVGSTTFEKEFNPLEIEDIPIEEFSSWFLEREEEAAEAVVTSTLCISGTSLQGDTCPKNFFVKSQSAESDAPPIGFTELPAHWAITEISIGKNAGDDSEMGSLEFAAEMSSYTYVNLDYLSEPKKVIYGNKQTSSWPYYEKALGTIEYIRCPNLPTIKYFGFSSLENNDLLKDGESTLEIDVQLSPLTIDKVNVIANSIIIKGTYDDDTTQDLAIWTDISLTEEKTFEDDYLVPLYIPVVPNKVGLIDISIDISYTYKPVFSPNPSQDDGVLYGETTSEEPLQKVVVSSMPEISLADIEDAFVLALQFVDWDPQEHWKTCEPEFNEQRIFQVTFENSQYGVEAYGLQLIIEYLKIESSDPTWHTLSIHDLQTTDGFLEAGESETWYNLALEEVEGDLRVLRKVGRYMLKYTLEYKYDDLSLPEGQQTRDGSYILNDDLNVIFSDSPKPSTEIEVKFLSPVIVTVTSYKVSETGNRHLNFEVTNPHFRTSIFYTLLTKANDFSLVFGGLEDFMSWFDVLTNVGVDAGAPVLGTILKAVDVVLALATYGFDVAIKTTYYLINFFVYRYEKVIESGIDKEFTVLSVGLTERSVFGDRSDNHYTKTSFKQLANHLDKGNTWATNIFKHHGKEYFGFNNIEAKLDINIVVRDKYFNPCEVQFNYDIDGTHGENVDLNLLEDQFAFNVQPCKDSIKDYKRSVHWKIASRASTYAAPIEFGIALACQAEAAAIMVMMVCCPILIPALEPVRLKFQKLAKQYAICALTNGVLAGLAALASAIYAALAMVDPDPDYQQIVHPTPYNLVPLLVEAPDDARGKKELAILSELFGLINASRITRFRLEEAKIQNDAQYVELQANALYKFSKNIQNLLHQYIVHVSVSEFEGMSEEEVEELVQTIKNQGLISESERLEGLPNPALNNPYFEEGGDFYPTNAELESFLQNEFNSSYISNSSTTYYDKLQVYYMALELSLYMEKSAFEGLVYQRTVIDGESIQNLTYEQNSTLTTLNQTMYDLMDARNSTFENTVRDLNDTMWSYFYATNNISCTIYLADIFHAEFVLFTNNTPQVIGFSDPVIIEDGNEGSFSIQLSNIGYYNSTYILDLVDYSDGLATNWTYPINHFLIRGTPILINISTCNAGSLPFGDYYLLYKLYLEDNPNIFDLYNVTIKVVHYDFECSLEKNTISITPGVNDQLIFNVTNLGNIQDYYYFNVSGLPKDWITYQMCGHLYVDESLNYSLRFHIPRIYTSSPGIYDCELNITSLSDPSLSFLLPFTLEVLPFHEFSYEVAVLNNIVFCDEVALFNLSITNLGNTMDTFTINLDFDSSWIIQITDEVTLNPGESVFQIIELTPLSGYSLEGSFHGFTLGMVSQGDSSVSQELPLVIRVLSLDDILLNEDGSGSVSWSSSDTNTISADSFSGVDCVVNSGVNHYDAYQLAVSDFLDLSNWDGRTMVHLRVKFRTTSTCDHSSVTQFLLMFLDADGEIIPLENPFGSAFYNASQGYHYDQYWLSGTDSDWQEVFLDVTHALRLFAKSSDKVKLAWGHFDAYSDDDEQKEYLERLLLYDTGVPFTDPPNAYLFDDFDYRSSLVLNEPNLYDWWLSSSSGSVDMNVVTDSTTGESGLQFHSEDSGATREITRDLGVSASAQDFICQFQINWDKDTYNTNMELQFEILNVLYMRIVLYYTGATGCYIYEVDPFGTVYLISHYTYGGGPPCHNGVFLIDAKRTNGTVDAKVFLNDEILVQRSWFEDRLAYKFRFSYESEFRYSPRYATATLDKFLFWGEAPIEGDQYPIYNEDFDYSDLNDFITNGGWYINHVNDQYYYAAIESHPSNNELRLSTYCVEPFYVQHSFEPVRNGTFMVEMKATHDSAMFIQLLNSSGAKRCDVELNTLEGPYYDGSVRIYDYTSDTWHNVVSLGGYSYYIFRIETDYENNLYRVLIGREYHNQHLATSDWYSMGGSGELSAIRLGIRDDSNGHFDNVAIFKGIHNYQGIELPQSPTNVQAEQAYFSSDKLLLTWDVADYADYYNIYLAESEDEPYIHYTSTLIEYNQSVISGLKTGKEYLFRVSGVNNNGEGELSTSYGMATTYASPCPAPTVTAQGPYNIHLQWEEVSDAIEYKVYYSLDNNDYYYLATCSTSQREYTHNGLDSETTYYYKIIVVYEEAESSLLDTSYGSGTTEASTEPQNLYNFGFYQNRYLLCWLHPEAGQPNNYKIYSGGGDGSSWTYRTTMSGIMHSFFVYLSWGSGSTASWNYYAVVAVYGTEEGEWAYIRCKDSTTYESWSYRPPAVTGELRLDDESTNEPFLLGESTLLVIGLITFASICCSSHVKDPIAIPFGFKKNSRKKKWE